MAEDSKPLVRLPKITPEHQEAWRDAVTLLEWTEGVGYGWTQEAVDFACEVAAPTVLAEIERLRALLTPPEMIGHTHEWETVSATGGPRMRCRGCGFLGLPAVETSGGPSVELYEVALSMLSALDHGTHIEPSSGFHTQLKTLLAEKTPALAPEGHKPTCFVYRYARALIGADRRGMCDCGFEASQIKQCPGLDIKEALTQASQ